MMVRYPRLLKPLRYNIIDNMNLRKKKINLRIFSIRNKRVVGVSCGGLHNAVYTDEGQVFTW